LYEKIFLFIFSLLIIAGGFYVFAKPHSIASFLKIFYGNYPIVRYAGEKQLTSRPIFIRFGGIVIIIVGLVCAVSMIVN
jgi:hypothetical protein